MASRTIRPPQIKAPAEILLITIDFVLNVPSGGTISTATITAVDRDTGLSSTSTVVSGAATINGTEVTQKIIAGTDGEQHVLTWTLTYSDTSKTEHELLLVINKGMV